MRAKPLAVLLSLLAVLVLFGVGCPQDRDTQLTLYVLNMTSAPIDQVQIWNQQTGELDSVNTDPVAPRTMAAIHLSKATYGSASTRIEYASTTGGFSATHSDAPFESGRLVGRITLDNISTNINVYPVLDDPGKALAFAEAGAPIIEENPMSEPGN